MTQRKIDRMGVFILMAHLIITLAILTIWALMAITGKGDTTLITTLIPVVIGYWFGSMGANVIRPSTRIEANEVKVQRPDNEKDTSVTIKRKGDSDETI